MLLFLKAWIDLCRSLPGAAPNSVQRMLPQSVDSLNLHLSAALMFYFAQAKAAEAKFGRKFCLVKYSTHPHNSRLQKHFMRVQSQCKVLTGSTLTAFLAGFHDAVIAAAITSNIPTA
jgi:hypothetical protein